MRSSCSNNSELSSPEPLDVPENDALLPAYPQDIQEGKLVRFVDAAYANKLIKRHSTTGYAFTYSGGAIVYQSKTQSLTALSSTKAEFIAAVTAEKQQTTFDPSSQSLDLRKLNPHQSMKITSQLLILWHQANPQKEQDISIFGTLQSRTGFTKQRM